MYRLNVATKTWNKMNTNFLNNNSFSYIYAHSTIIYNNMMYLFGGKNYKNGNYIVGLWCLNLESFNWKRQELKCSSPPPRLVKFYIDNKLLWCFISDLWLCYMVVEAAHKI